MGVVGRGGLLRWIRAACAGAALAGATVATAGSPADDEAYRAGLRAYESSDLRSAMRLLRVPADAGHAASQVLLADILEKAGYFEDSVAYFRRAAEAGDPQGCFGLGSAYAEGRGIVRDPAQARAWITRAAEQGHALAINTLAQAWMGGGLDIAATPRPGDEALAWIRRAADNRHLPSIDYLARGYRSGLFGEPDLALAASLEARAEKLRYPNGRPTPRRRSN